MNTPFQIALCCNGTMLPGLHGTLASLVSHLSQREKVGLTVFIDDINDAEREALRGTVEDAGGVGNVHFQEADSSAFKDLKTLHGQWMIYLRLFLPRLLPEADKILYLDSDLVVSTDVCALFENDLGSYPLAAIDGGEVQWCLDHAFLKVIGLTDTDRSFNSGILIFNATKWRQDSLVDQALQMARTHTDILTSHDQSVLNAMFSRNFYKLGRQYNMSVSPTDKPLGEIDGIYHFVGSPKPWDPFGKYFHRNWKVWNDVIQRTRFDCKDFMARHSKAVFKRAWSLRRSYLRTLQRR